MSINNINRKEDVEFTFVISNNLNDLPLIPAKEVYIALKSHLDYLIDIHRRYIVCFTYKEGLDKKTLESKIQSLTERVTKLKQQIDKHSKNE